MRVIIFAIAFALTPVRSLAYDFLYTSGARVASPESDALVLSGTLTNYTYAVKSVNPYRDYVTVKQKGAGRTCTRDETSSPDGCVLALSPTVAFPNPEVPFTPEAGSELAVALGRPEVRVNDVPARIDGLRPRVYEIHCESLSPCTVLVLRAGTTLGRLTVNSGDYREIELNSLGDGPFAFRGPPGARKNVLTVFDGSKMIWWNDLPFVNASDWNTGLIVDVGDVLESTEAGGPVRTWETELHMDTVLYKKGGDGGYVGHAPNALVTADYPDGEISLNSGGTWFSGHAVRKWDNFDGSGWLGLRARTTLTEPGEYIGTLHLTVELL